MNDKIKEFEVMAPVGSRESLAAAIQAGADSVYFGIGKLNMRSHSANHFTIDDLREIAATHPNVALADWDAALQGTTGQLQSDGIHPSRIGQHLFAKTIRTALAELTTRHTGVTPTLPELPIP